MGLVCFKLMVLLSSNDLRSSWSHGGACKVELQSCRWSSDNGRCGHRARDGMEMAREQCVNSA